MEVISVKLPRVSAPRVRLVSWVFAALTRCHKLKRSVMWGAGRASCESVTCEVLGPTCIWCLVLPIEYLGRPCQKLNWLSSVGHWGVLFEYLYLDRHTFLFDKETMTWFYSVHPEFFLSILSWTKPTSYCWSVDWVLATSVKSLCKMWGWDLVSRILSKRSHRFLC